MQLLEKTKYKVKIKPLQNKPDCAEYKIKQNKIQFKPHLADLGLLISLFVKHKKSMTRPWAFWKSQTRSYYVNL